MELASFMGITWAFGVLILGTSKPDSGRKLGESNEKSSASSKPGSPAEASKKGVSIQNLLI